MGKVSICIPAYNNVQSVRRLLESVEEQTFRDYEVIITDDSEEEGIEALAAEKGYVRYYKNKKRLGATANWNAAIARAEGEYIKIMHHDDWFTDKDSLSAFVKLLDENKEAAFAFSGTRQVEGDGSFDRFTADKDIAFIKADYRNLFLGNTIGAPSAVIVRRSACNTADKAESVYDEKLTWLVDMEYYMHFLKENPHFVYTKEPLVSIGVGKEQLTEQCRDNTQLNAEEYGYIYKKYALGEPNGNISAAFKEKLISVFLEAGKTCEEAEVFGIPEGEYAREQKKKLFGKIKWKLTHFVNGKNMAFLLLALFCLSLIPILMLSGVNHAAGDDFGYGTLTHAAWKATHSLPAVIRAAFETVGNYYRGWQGTWFSIFLFAFQPEVFSPDAYVIVPALMLAVWIGATVLLLHDLLVRTAGLDKRSFAMIAVLLMSAVLQYLPSTKSGIFWYNGTAHYVIPYAIALLGIYFYLKFMRDDGKKQWKSYAGLTVCMFLLGGANYQAALLTPIVTILLSLLFLKDRGKRKKLAAFLFPLMLEAAGLMISMKSPGNVSRGGAEFGFSISLVLGTIFDCFVQGAVNALFYVKKNPLLLLIFAAAAVVIWKAFEKKENKKKYPLPEVFLLLSFCVYCAMLAPQLYAGVEVSGGVYNMNFYIFVFMVFGDMIYLEGFLSNYMASGQKKRTNQGKRILIRNTVCVLLGAVFLLVFRSDIRNMTTVRCMEYKRSGQAADFKSQMELQKKILLDDEIKDALLPAINDEQGPLMHMPLTENPDAWSNTVMREFYGKDSVTAIPRELWNELDNREAE